MVERHPAISTEGKISIVLALVGLLGAGAIMVSPGQVWIGWSLIIIAVVGFVILLLYHVISRRRQHGQAYMIPMTPGDVGYNIAIVAAVTASLSAFWRKRTIAIMAAMVAVAAIGFDFWYGPPRTLIFLDHPDKLVGSPLGWKLSAIYPLYNIKEPTNFGTITIVGGNTSDKEVQLDDVYLISGITGARLNLHVSWAGVDLSAKDLNPIPPDAPILMFANAPSAKGLTQKDFLEGWATFALIAEYNGEKHRVIFDRETVLNAFPKALPIGPHISPKKPS